VDKQFKIIKNYKCRRHIQLESTFKIYIVQARCPSCWNWHEGKEEEDRGGVSRCKRGSWYKLSMFEGTEKRGNCGRKKEKIHRRQ